MHVIYETLRNLSADHDINDVIPRQIAAQRKEHESRASDLAAEQVKVSRLNDEVKGELT